MQVFGDEEDNQEFGVDGMEEALKLGYSTCNTHRGNTVEKFHTPVVK